MAHTIFSGTSPVEKDLPPFFFQKAMLPSVIVGDTTGISRLVMAQQMAVWYRPPHIDSHEHDTLYKN